MRGTYNSDHVSALHAFWPRSVNFMKALGELDVSAPRILDEGDRDIQRRHFRVGSIELDAHPFEVFAERLEPLHLKADMVEHAATRAGHGCR